MGRVSRDAKRSKPIHRIKTVRLRLFKGHHIGHHEGDTIHVHGRTSPRDAGRGDQWM